MNFDTFDTFDVKFGITAKNPTLARETQISRQTCQTCHEGHISPPTAAPSCDGAMGAQAADRLPWPVWRIVHNRRWTRSVTGPDYLAWQGRVIAIVFDREEGGYRFDLGEGRSAGSWPMALAAKTAAAEAVLAMPRRDKERAAAIRLLRENEALRETQERMNDDDIIDD